MGRDEVVFYGLLGVLCIASLIYARVVWEKLIFTTPRLMVFRGKEVDAP